MANEQNLVPFGQLPESKQREIRKKGALAAAKARRAKADFKAAILKALEEDGGDSLRDIVNGMILSAAKGNHKAAEFLRDTIGQKPVEKVESSENVKVTYGWQE